MPWWKTGCPKSRFVVTSSPSSLPPSSFLSPPPFLSVYFIFRRGRAIGKATSSRFVHHCGTFHLNIYVVSQWLKTSLEPLGCLSSLCFALCWTLIGFLQPENIPVCLQSGSFSSWVSPVRLPRLIPASCWAPPSFPGTSWIIAPSLSACLFFHVFLLKIETDIWSLVYALGVHVCPKNFIIEFHDFLYLASFLMCLSTKSNLF